MKVNQEKNLHSNDSEVEIRKVFAERLRKLRKTCGVSQSDLGNFLGLNQSGLSRVEQGHQNLTYVDVLKICEFFGIKPDALFSGNIFYWTVAKRFGRYPKLPEAYKKYRYSKVREILPFVIYLNKKMPSQESQSFLEDISMDFAIHTDPNEEMSVNCSLALMRKLKTQNLISQKSQFNSLIDQTRSEVAHGLLFPVYQMQNSAKDLLKVFMLNQSHYQGNYFFQVLDETKSSVVVLMEEAEHMKEVPIQGVEETLDSYYSGYLKEFPKLIGERPFRLTREKSLFLGDSKGIYRLEA